MSDTEDTTGTTVTADPGQAPTPIDTSDAASADGPAERMSGRVRTADPAGSS